MDITHIIEQYYNTPLVFFLLYLASYLFRGKQK